LLLAISSLVSNEGRRISSDPERKSNSVGIDKEGKPISGEKKGQCEGCMERGHFYRGSSLNEKKKGGETAPKGKR